MRLKNAIILTLIFTFFAATPAFPQDIYRVDRVVDGDTIALDNGLKVRLIGVDTPETKHPNKPVEYYGKEASAFTTRMCEGKRVRLEYDWEKTDRYGRILAYVFVLEGGTEIFLNAEIIKQGYGHAYVKYPFKDEYMQAFREYERQARENGRGLWGEKQEVSKEDPGKKAQQQEAITVYITKTGSKYHRAGCRYLSKSCIPISLEEAVRRGYTPCSVCRPPVLH